MKYIFVLIFFSTLFVSCKKEVVTTPVVTSKISQDSMVKSIHQKWKFTVVVANPAISTKLNNWENWRNFANELTITPNASLRNFVHKSNGLVEKVAVLKNDIPEMYNKQETKARISLLETHIQNLNMQLELEPLNVKEINSLLTNIQKNTNSIINQFNEFEIKSKIPKELGEDQLIQPIDTIKRATLNAIPQE